MAGADDGAKEPARQISEEEHCGFADESEPGDRGDSDESHETDTSCEPPTAYQLGELPALRTAANWAQSLVSSDDEPSERAPKRKARPEVPPLAALPEETIEDLRAELGALGNQLSKMTSSATSRGVDELISRARENMRTLTSMLQPERLSAARAAAARAAERLPSARAAAERAAGRFPEARAAAARAAEWATKDGALRATQEWRDGALRATQEWRDATKDGALRATKPLRRTAVRSARVLRKSVRTRMTGNPDQRVSEAVWDAEKFPTLVRWLDKWCFSLGVMNFAVTEAILLVYPDIFWVWYLLNVPLLVGYKFVAYRRLKWHFFLLDYCYLVNLLIGGLLLLAPANCRLFKALFAPVFGPMSLAIYIYRNSLVFHDVDRISSFYIHIFPMLLMYNLRFPRPDAKAFSFFSLDFHSDQPSSLSGLGECGAFDGRDFVNYLLMWGIWAAGYHFATEVLWREWIESDPEIVTNVRYLTSNEKGAITRLARAACRRMGLMAKGEKFDATTVKTKLVFYASHFVYTTLTAVLAPFWYSSKYAALLYMLYLVLAAVFNGASFYIEVFSRKYQDQFTTKPPPSGGDTIAEPEPSTETATVSAAERKDQ